MTPANELRRTTSGAPATRFRAAMACLTNWFTMMAWWQANLPGCRENDNFVLISYPQLSSLGSRVLCHSQEGSRVRGSGAVAVRRPFSLKRGLASNP